MTLPLAYTTVANPDSAEAEIYAEMEMLRHSFQPPPTRTTDGIDYFDYVHTGDRPPSWDDSVTPDFGATAGQPAYDRLLELRGTLRLPIGGGKTQSMKDSLLNLINDPGYQSLSPVSDASGPSPRVRLIQGRIGAFHQLAMEQVLREYPDLKRDLAEKRRNRMEKFR